MKIIHIFAFLAIFYSACQPSHAPVPNSPAPQVSVPPTPFSSYAKVDTTTYTFYGEGEHFILKNRQNGQTYNISQDQLAPRVEKGMEPQLEVHYDPLVMAIPTGKGMVCLYLFSYEIADGGSLALAEGYDLFLLLDKVSNRVLPAVLQLGQTRGRHKAMGYMEATYTRFYVSCPSEDDVCWIGTRKEEVSVDWDSETGGIKGGPYHDISALTWYRFNGTAWLHDPKLDRLLPRGKGAGELPPTTSLTPIDMALQVYRNRPY